ncbi:MAG: ABC transporter substrate-binding protein [Thermaceae bacterium]|nr:ABC transporter substrate-binding protein [Thermaceae bacterium]
MKSVFALLIALGMGLALAQKGPITIGSKIDTEGSVLCEMVRTVLEGNGFKVNDRCSFGTTNVVRKALTSGEIDLYPEYTGTAAYFPEYKDVKFETTDPAKLYAKVREVELKNNIVWLQPAPANNTWAIAVPKALADKEGLKTIADLSKYVNAGKPIKLAGSQEFFDREDAFKAFSKVYGFNLKPDQMVVLPGGNTTQTEQAAAKGTNGVNAAMAYGTDGGIAALGLVALTDSKGAVAVYQPAITVRKAVFDKYPELASLIDPVFKTLNEATLSSLNAQVAVDGKNPKDVAQAYLKSKGLLK